MLYAITLAFATLTALNAGDEAGCRVLGAVLAAVPEELLDGEEFPHLMLWAKSRACAVLGHCEEARTLLSASGSLHTQR